jgi:hypothetical protein
VLLTVFAGMPGSDRIFALCSLVVLLSVVLHGGSLMLVPKSRREEPAAEPPRPSPPPAEPPQPIAGPRGDAPSAQEATEKVSIDEMRQLQAAGEPVIVLDVRTARSRGVSGQVALETVRVDPERAAFEAERLRLPREAWLVAFCA